MREISFQLAIPLGFGLLFATASLGEESFPRLEAEISIEIQNDNFFDSEDSTAELNDLFTTTEPYLRFRLTPEFSLEAGLVMEPTAAPGPSEDRVFEDHGVYFEQLFLNYETDTFALYGGKFNPSFGTAWDIAPGIYGADFAEDYELTERIGLGGALNLGAHRLSANVFFADTSVLSESAFTNRGRTRQSSGGVSNTQDLSSFSLTLDGGDFPGLPGLGYHLGFLHQEAGVSETDNEQGFVGGLNGSFPLVEDLTFEPMVELAFFADGGGLDQDINFVTTGGAIVRDPWNLSLSYTNRDTEAHAAALTNANDHLFQASVGYAFDFGLGVDVGYRFAEEGNVDSHAFGVLLTYALEFSAP